MKKILVLAAMLSLCFQAVSVFAATPDFSGYWELDVSKSTFPKVLSVESIRLKVWQTEKELKIESTIKVKESQMQAGQIPVNSKTETTIYSFEEPQTTVELGSGKMARKDTRRAAVTADGKLSLTITRIFDAAKGTAAVKINEIWELLDEGKTLKATRYVESPEGAVTMEMYFTKKTSVAAIKGNEVYQGAAITDPNYKPKMISGGVINGKAVTLVKPKYPAEARAARVSGAVNVKVVIDEEGNVISAEAISGDPLLGAASVEAAKQSKFSSTTLEGNPVKVSGVIIYNFVP